MLDRRQLIAFFAMIPTIATFVHHASAQPTSPMSPSMPGMAPGPMTAETCIESCWRSHVMCLETERYCIEKGGVHAMPKHLILLADCAEMCQKAANSLIRRSSQHAAVCIACAELCDACAQECEAFKDDERMLQCAKTARDCSSHCREMSKLPI